MEVGANGRRLIRSVSAIKIESKKSRCSDSGGYRLVVAML